MSWHNCCCTPMTDKMRPEERKRRYAVVLSPALVAAIDNGAKQIGLSRSSFLETLLRRDLGMVR